MSLDATDKRILSALQKSGRMSNSALSDAVNLSPSACHRRVQRLETEGYIRDYVALLDARKVGVPSTVFVEITLRGQVLPVGGIKEKILAAKRAGIKEIVMCHRNKQDVDEIDARYVKGLRFTYVSDIHEVVSRAVLNEKNNSRV